MTADLELQERLGHGDLAEVWKAFDPQVQHYVAVKLFDADLLNDPAFMTFYQNLPRLPEAQRIVSLQHPNIVRLHGFHITPASEAEEALAYLVMDYIAGPTLAGTLGHPAAGHNQSTGAVDGARPETTQASRAVDVEVRSNCRRRFRNLVAVRAPGVLVVDDLDRTGGWNAVADAENLRQPVRIRCDGAECHRHATAL